jgi:hypothetical protein
MKLFQYLFPGLLMAGWIFANPLAAQEISADSKNLRDDAARIFIDCQRCDMDYIRREIPYVNYVRDVTEAQVYVLETAQMNGSGGRTYTFTFVGQENFTGMNDTLAYSSGPDDTDETRRQGRTQILKMGLMRYVAKSPLQGSVKISPLGDFEEEEVVDRWNYWVFRLSTRPEIEAQDTRSDFELRNSVSAVKITEEWKIELDYDHEYRRTKYTFDDTLYNRYRSGQQLENLIVKSLGEHWSAGGKLELNSSTFNNTKFSIDVLPSIEYNIFPYSQSSHHQFRFLYSIGNSSRLYYDSTIYGKIEENLFLHRLQMAFQVQDKWGDVNISLIGSNYLHDFSKNRIELQGDLEVRIFKGLAIRLSGSVARIRDQLALPKEDLSEADILLSLQELQTGYQVRSSVSLTYTFGSIYNNIVNPRFGDGDDRRRR